MKKVLNIAEELGLLEGVAVIYGAAGVGKTTLTLAAMREADRPKLYIASEPNIFYNGRIDMAKKYAEADYVKELPEAFRKALQFVQKHEGAFVAIDSVSAFAQHEAAKRMALEGENPQPLAVVAQLSFAANAMSQALAEYAVRKKATIWLVAQERPAIGGSWRGEPAAPSFAMRALHSVFKVVMHRNEKKVGEIREVPVIAEL